MSSDTSLIDLVHRVMDGGIPDRIPAIRALHATLHVLAERLTEDEAVALARCLPDQLAQVVRRVQYDSDFDDAELYERVRRRTHEDLGMAREKADIVLRVLGGALDPDVRTRLARALPDGIRSRLFEPEHEEAPPHPQAKSAPRIATLATGRPGSRNPLAEARPDRAQLHSVARNPEPHSETKLSTSRGLTQERLEDSLAKGRPPQPLRPVAEAKDK